MNTQHHALLKQRFDDHKDRLSEASSIRIHRALSWLRRAEQEDEDPDARFIFLWIGLNAAYAQEFGVGEPERRRLAHFVGALVQVDGEGRLHDLVFQQFSGVIRNLISNKYVFEPFWKALREHDASDAWQREFEGSRKAAMHALMGKQVAATLGVIFDRLYVLRNQLVHGGATWRSSVNRQQVEDGARLLGLLLPLVIGLLVEHPELELGDVLYPVV